MCLCQRVPSATVASPHDNPRTPCLHFVRSRGFSLGSRARAGPGQRWHPMFGEMCDHSVQVIAGRPGSGRRFKRMRLPSFQCSPPQAKLASNPTWARNCVWRSTNTARWIRISHGSSVRLDEVSFRTTRLVRTTPEWELPQFLLGSLEGASVTDEVPTAYDSGRVEQRRQNPASAVVQHVLEPASRQFAIGAPEYADLFHLTEILIAAVTKDWTLNHAPTAWGRRELDRRTHAERPVHPEHAAEANPGRARVRPQQLMAARRRMLRGKLRACPRRTHHLRRVVRSGNP
jgi:hypothetical protein